MRIRSAGIEELPFFQDIERAAGQCFRGIGMPEIADDDPLPLDELARYQRAGLAWVAVDGTGRPVAYLIAEPVDGDLHVEQVSVHPGSARRRVGRSLLDHLASRAAAEGIPALTLTAGRVPTFRRHTRSRKAALLPGEPEVSMSPNPPEVRLTGHGLVLREWTEEDLGAMVELFDDPDVAYRTPFVSPFDLAAARDHLRKGRRARIDGRRIHLAITTDGRQARGEVLLNRSFGGIGYVVGAAHRGQRLAVRALRLMTEYAHQAMATPRVLLEIEPDNHASAAVARIAGFHITDTTPELVEDKGRSYTLLTWAHHAP